MQNPHRMQLKGPWQYTWQCDADNSESQVKESGHVKIPDAWHLLFRERIGMVRLSRRFGKPTNLDENESVHLVFEQTNDLRKLQLNQQELSVLPGELPQQDFEITYQLKENNLIEADFWVDGKQAQPLPLFKAVFLEIRVH